MNIILRAEVTWAIGIMEVGKFEAGKCLTMVGEKRMLANRTNLKTKRNSKNIKRWKMANK